MRIRMSIDGIGEKFYITSSLLLLHALLLSLSLSHFTEMSLPFPRPVIPSSFIHSFISSYIIQSNLVPLHHLGSLIASLFLSFTP